MTDLIVLTLDGIGTKSQEELTTSFRVTPPGDALASNGDSHFKDHMAQTMEKVANPLEKVVILNKWVAITNIL